MQRDENHPRPQLTRLGWTDLSGSWQFNYDDEDVGLNQCWYNQPDDFKRTIIVPFPPESKASGIGDPRPLVKLEQVKGEWVLGCQTEAGILRLGLPSGFDPYVYQQFRFRRYPDKLLVSWENFEAGEVKLEPVQSSIALYAHRATVAFDMVRVTPLPVF